MSGLDQVAARSPNDIHPEQRRHQEFKIRLIDPNHRPIRCKARPLPYNLRDSVKEALDLQLDAGIIRPSRSEWAAPLQIVHKSDGTIRLTVDYTALNEIIQFDPYPMPSTKTLFLNLTKSNWFSKFDFLKAYHQFPNEPASIKYTAFICEFGLYEYTSMPMGISTAAAWFQRCIEIELKDFIDRNVLSAFIDDTILHTSDLEQHLLETNKLIEAFNKTKLTISLNKCKIAQREIEFLGHVIRAGSIHNCPKRAEGIKVMPVPTTINGLQRALGIFNYQREFVDHYAELAGPLYALMNLKNVPDKWRKRNGAVNGKLAQLNWNEEALTSFQKLKEETSKTLTIHMPDFNKPFDLTTDASEYGYGAYLSQTIDQVERIIGYYSKTYTPAQKNYATNEKELLAIVMAIEHFHIYLYGRRFTVFTDHQPLTYLLKKKEPSKRLERWKERSQVYTFDIKFKPGTENIIADALSRYTEDMPELEPNTNGPHIEEFEEDYNDILIASTTLLTNNNHTPLSIEHCINIISSLPTSETDDEYEVYQQEQAKDNDITWIRDLITEYGDERPIIKTFENNNRRLFYKEYDSLQVLYGILYKETEDKKGKRTILFVLPKDNVEGVLNKIHNSVYGGHLGRKKTALRVQERFYRPFLKDDIKNYIKTCDICQKVKTLNKKTRAEMKIMSPNRPGEIIASDFAGPFVITPKGNKYIQVITDLFSKTLLVKPVPNKETTTAAKTIIEDWCCIYGFPETCLTDGGKEYQSGIWDATCELLDIKRIKTTPFHPECDGQSERAVQTIKRMLTAYINDNQNNWDESLQQLVYAYNTSVHQSTKFSPFEITFGFKGKMPIDLMYPNREELTRPAKTQSTTIILADKIDEFDLPEHPTYTEFDELHDVNTMDLLEHKVASYIETLKSNLENSYKCLKTNKQLRMVYAKEAHDRNIKKQEYQINDKVLCNHP